MVKICLETYYIRAKSYGVYLIWADVYIFFVGLCSAGVFLHSGLEIPIDDRLSKSIFIQVKSTPSKEFQPLESESLDTNGRCFGARMLPAHSGRLRVETRGESFEVVVV